MGALDSLQDGISEIFGDVTGFVGEHPVGTAIGVGSAVGVGVGIGAIASARRKKTTRSKTTRGRKRDRRYISKQKHERKRVRKKGAKIYGRKGKWLSRTKKAGSKRTKKRVGKVYYARKTGQPYKILSSGKAKFIKGKRRKR